MSFNNVGSGQARAYFNEINDNLDKIVNDKVESSNDGAYHNNRTPWIMSTTQWLEDGYGINWWCNPSDISWNMPLRQSISKNANSTVVHNWPKGERGTHFDEFTINLSLQSGNLQIFNRKDPWIKSATKQQVFPPGINNFYAFLKLMDAPRLLDDGRTNHVVIQYNSNIFPKLTLIGQFDSSGVRFNDSANDPNNISSWGATFIVQDTSPRLSDNTKLKTNADLLNTYLNNMYPQK